LIWWFELLFLVALSERILIYVVNFDSFVKILEGQWKWYRRFIIFNAQHDKVECKLQNQFFKPMGS
jgi:hypothetical protein